MDPKAVNPKASMPKLGISSEEADKLLAFLEWTSKVDTNGWPPKPIFAVAAGVGGKELTEGQKIYQSLKLFQLSFHKRNRRTTGPEITNVGSKRDRAWLTGHFKNPSAYVPNSAMPAYGNLKEKELNDLTDYMLTLKQEVKK